MIHLHDKTIVVTGGKGLLGSNMVDTLRKAGATVFSVDIVPSEDPYSVQGDTTSEPEIERIVNDIIARAGKIDGWVNNAYPRTADWGKKFEDVPYDSFVQNTESHLLGYVACCRAAASAMIKSGGGSIVNMASIYGVTGPDFSVYDGTEMTMPAAYSFIKGGIINFTRYLASYYGNKGIRVNAVSPGGIANDQPASFVKSYNAKVPLGRMGVPDDISPAVAFLVSDLSGYITGQNFIVDGGWTCI